MADSKLKPCPFCSGEAEIKVRKINTRWRRDRGEPRYRVHCTNKSASCMGVYVNRYYDTEEEAVKAWDRRANDGEAD